MEKNYGEILSVEELKNINPTELVEKLNSFINNLDLKVKGSQRRS